MVRKTLLALSIAALAAISGTSMAQQPPAPAAPAAQPAPGAPGNGPVARAEENVKKAGRATKRVAKKAGAATKRGAQKAGAAVTSTGEAITKKLPPDPHPKDSKKEKMKS